MNLIAESTEVMDLNQAIRRIAEFRDRDAFIIVYNFFSPPAEKLSNHPEDECYECRRTGSGNYA